MEEEFKDRASLYLAMTLALIGFEEGIEFSKKIGANLEECDKKALKASVLRLDYDPVTRSLLPRAISEFYERAGFEALDEPDSLITMLAFMAQMARQDCMESIKIQHRFLRTHLIPTLYYAMEKCQGLKPFLDVIREDANYLRRVLITAYK